MLSPIGKLGRRTGFVKLPRPLRISAYLVTISCLLFLFIRSLELFAIFHPLPYTFDEQWNWYLPPKSEEVWFTNADGMKMNGWLIRSRQPSIQGTILYCHGNSGNLTHVSPHAQKLAERGFDVLLFDYRCYGRSDCALPDETGIFQDTTAAYQYLIRERGVKPETLTIYGWSLGTTAAIEVATKFPCRNLIVEAGLSSAPEMAGAMLPWLPPQLYWLGKNRLDSVNKIGNVSCPVLIAHGTEDEMIPVEQGRKLFAAAKEPKKLMEIVGGKHWVAEVGGQKYMDAVAEFITTNSQNTIVSK
jgi:hypothetical protein